MNIVNQEGIVPSTGKKYLLHTFSYELGRVRGDVVIDVEAILSLSGKDKVEDLTPMDLEAYARARLPYLLDGATDFRTERVEEHI